MSSSGADFITTRGGDEATNERPPPAPGAVVVVVAAAPPQYADAKDRISSALQAGSRPLPTAVAEGIATLASRMASDDVLLQRIRGIVAAEGLLAAPAARRPAAIRTDHHAVAAANHPASAGPMSPTWDAADRPLQPTSPPQQNRNVRHVDGVGEAIFTTENQEEGYDLPDDVFADAAVDELKEIFRSGPFRCTTQGHDRTGTASSSTTDTTPTSPPPPPPPSSSSLAASVTPSAAASGGQRAHHYQPRSAEAPPPPMQQAHDHDEVQHEDPVYALAARVVQSRSILHSADDGEDADADAEESTHRLGNAVASLWSAIVTTLFEPTSAAASTAANSTNASPQRAATSTSNTVSPDARQPGRYAGSHSRAPSGDLHHATSPVVRASVAAAASKVAHLSRSSSALDVTDDSARTPQHRTTQAHGSPSRLPPPGVDGGASSTGGGAGMQQQGEDAAVVTEQFLIAAALLVNSTLLWLAMSRHAAGSGGGSGGVALQGTPFSNVVTKVAGVLQSAFFAQHSPQPSP